MNALSTEPLYREDLQCLLDLVMCEIGRRGNRATRMEQAALGALYAKLTHLIAITPSMVAS